MPEVPPAEAVMVTGPTAIVETKPALFTTARFVSDDPQATSPVISCVVPSASCPKARNCSPKPSAKLSLTGNTVIEFSEGRLDAINTVVLPRNGPERAVIVTLPAFPAVAKMPFAATVAIELSEDDQFALELMSGPAATPRKPRLARSGCWVPVRTMGFAGWISSCTGPIWPKRGSGTQMDKRAISATRKFILQT